MIRAIITTSQEAPPESTHYTHEARPLTIETGNRLLAEPEGTCVTVEVEGRWSVNCMRGALRKWMQARGWKLKSVYQDGKLKLWRGAKL